jgi:hypothetical protein
MAANELLIEQIFESFKIRMRQVLHAELRLRYRQPDLRRRRLFDLEGHLPAWSRATG